MSKFKVGDVVIGNAMASARYNITAEGWKGKVTKIEDAGHFRAVAVLGSECADVNFRLEFDYFDLVERPCQKIVVTTEGKTTTARLFAGKELVKSAEAKCSPRDTFDFETGAALALDRLLGREKAEPEAPKFTKSDLKTGLFGRMNDGRWFVVLGERLLYGQAVDSGCLGGYDNIERLNADLTFNSGAHIDLVVEAVSFFNARDKVRRGAVLWSRPGAKFE